jgi:Glycosyltransferase family 87
MVPRRTAAARMPRMSAAPRLSPLTLLGGVAVILATALLVGTFVSLIPQVTGWPGPFVDWRTYENAAGRLLAGDAIYAPEQLAGPYHLTEMLLVGYAYPPASVPLLIPFQGYPLGLAAWITVNLGALLTALWAIASRAWPTYRLLAFALALVGLAMFPPFLAGMIAMSTNVGLAGAIGWVAVGLTARQAGVLGGVLAILKVFAGAITFGSPEDKTKAFVTAVAVVAGLTLVTLPIVGFQDWLDFGTALTGAVPDCSGFNVSIACTLADATGLALGWGSLVGVLVGGLAVLGMIVCRQPYLLSVLAAIAVMAPANNLHIHYWTIGYVIVVASLARLTVLARARTPAPAPSAA